MRNWILSKREQEVLTLLSYEYTSKEIAALLFISPHTVITHRKSIQNKLNAKNTAGLIRKGFENGLLNPS